MPLFSTRSPEDTLALGSALGQRLQRGDVVLLKGDLGAGKSVLARGLARGAGVFCAMPSPTFTLMQPYEGRIPFYHFDLYRLADPEEFYESGLEEYAFGDGAAVIEWPEQAELDPKDCFEMEITRGEGTEERRVHLTGRGACALREAEWSEAGEKWRCGT